MQTQTELSVLEPFEKGLTKLDIRNLADELVERVLEEGTPLKVAEGLSAIESFIKEVKEDKRFKDYVREETSKYPKGFVSNSGAKIKCFEAGVKYDFTQCGDIAWEKMDAEMKGLKDRITEREEFLKTVPIEGMALVNESDGEVYRIYPPSKTSSSSYKITLAK